MRCYLCGRAIEDYGVEGDEPDMVVVQQALRTDTVEEGFIRAPDEDCLHAHRDCFFTTVHK